ncbi:hypothetical protein KCP75_08950 [Salmonella enterica subsp. enterica]|nr:hypothetical protein KCP75_08950 [Salmonella enterica subsp. enterica]
MQIIKSAGTRRVDGAGDIDAGRGVNLTSSRSSRIAPAAGFAGFRLYRQQTPKSQRSA